MYRPAGYLREVHDALAQGYDRKIGVALDKRGGLGQIHQLGVGLPKQLLHRFRLGADYEKACVRLSARKGVDIRGNSIGISVEFCAVTPLASRSFFRREPLCRRLPAQSGCAFPLSCVNVVDSLRAPVENPDRLRDKAAHGVKRGRIDMICQTALNDAGLDVNVHPSKP